MNVTLTDDQTLEALDALSEDGTTYEFEADDGRVFVIKLHTGHDDEYWTDIAEHGDCYGHTAWTQRRRNDYGYSARPDSFDGAARKLPTSDGDLWWQPPADMRSRKAGGFETDGQYHAAFDQLFRLVRDIVEFGFISVGVSLHETLTDSLGGTHEVQLHSAWVGGVEPSPDREYMRDLVSDLLADLFHDD